MGRRKKAFSKSVCLQTQTITFSMKQLNRKSLNMQMLICRKPIQWFSISIKPRDTFQHLSFIYPKSASLKQGFTARWTTLSAVGKVDLQRVQPPSPLGSPSLSPQLISSYDD